MSKEQEIKDNKSKINHLAFLLLGRDNEAILYGKLDREVDSYVLW